jgi:dTDP-4-dehydrorhamnose reductase
VVETAAARGWPLKASAAAIAPISSAEYPAAAMRPMNSRLDTTKLRRTFSLDLPHWRVGVDAVLTELLAEQNQAEFHQ